MLKQRILTAVILIPLFLLLLFKASALVFCFATAFVVMLCAWEWSALMGLSNRYARLACPIVLGATLFFALWLPIFYSLVVSTIWWFLAIPIVVLYPKSSAIWGQRIWLKAIMGILVLVPCWLSINVLRNADNGVYLLFFLFILIWGADTGAYFVGKKWGKTKLAPQVSPGKSVQGLIGALITSLVIACIFLWWVQTPYDIWLEIIGLSLVTVLFSVLGDLFESMLKRNEGLKDSSNLLPGHGGILDRIDSLTAAAPIFVMGMLLMEKIFF